MSRMSHSTARRFGQLLCQWTPFRLVALLLAAMGSIPLLLQGKVVESMIVCLLAWLLSVPSRTGATHPEDKPIAQGLSRPLMLYYAIVTLFIAPPVFVAFVQGNIPKALALFLLSVTLASPFIRK